MEQLSNERPLATEKVYSEDFCAKKNWTKNRNKQKLEHTPCSFQQKFDQLLTPFVEGTVWARDHAQGKLTQPTLKRRQATQKSLNTHTAKSG